MVKRRRRWLIALERLLVEAGPGGAPRTRHRFGQWEAEHAIDVTNLSAYFPRRMVWSVVRACSVRLRLWRGRLCSAGTEVAHVGAAACPGARA